jgi:hypothetical protein
MGRKFMLLTDNSGVKFLFSQPDLNARQARWLAFLSEFDFEVRHIKGKENKVADALSRRTNGLFEISISREENDIEQRIKSASCNDEKYIKTVADLQGNAENLDRTDLSLDKNGLLRFKNRLYIPDSVELKLTILDEVHKNPYSGHPGYQKMVTTLRKLFYWPNMKGETTEYLSKCLDCQQVKVEHQHPAGLLQPLPIPEWKWEIISLDFITGLPKTQKQNDSIMVVIDKLSKSAHFIPVKSTYKAINIAEIFMKEIFRLHGIPKMVISDRDVKFTSTFWKELFAGLDTNLNFSTSYHPQMDGKTERTNQIVEDMLQMYVRTKPTKWEEYLHLVEFAYNNGYQTSAKMSPFEVLYDRKCTTLISWDNPVDRLMMGPEMLQEMEKMVRKVQHNLKEAQDRQKSYADLKRRHQEFQVGDHVYLKVKARRSSLKLGNCSKLAPRFCGPFEILARIGPVAYQLALPANLKVHNVFHVSLLKKYIHDPTHIIDWNMVQVEPEGEFQEEPLRILDRKETILRNRAIAQVKVQWKHFSPEEATWELEEDLQKSYPTLFRERNEH